MQRTYYTNINILTTTFFYKMKKTQTKKSHTQESMHIIDLHINIYYFIDDILISWYYIAVPDITTVPLPKKRAIKENECLRLIAAVLLFPDIECSSSAHPSSTEADADA